MATITEPVPVDTAVVGLAPLAKAPTGIKGLDQVTQGGVPRGRPTLVCGPAGWGHVCHVRILRALDVPVVAAGAAQIPEVRRDEVG